MEWFDRDLDVDGFILIYYTTWIIFNRAVVLHTVCYIIDAVQIAVALFIEHVLALSSYDLQRVRFVE